MKRKMIIAAGCLLLLFGGSLAGRAQKSIDSIQEELEKRDDILVSSVTKRDPKTKKITTQVKSYSFTDKTLTKKLEDAFKKEEEQATTVTLNRHPHAQGATDHSLRFDNGETHTLYNLIINSEGQTNFTITIRTGGKRVSVYSFTNPSDSSIWSQGNIRIERRLNKLPDSLRQTLRKHWDGPFGNP